MNRLRTWMNLVCEAMDPVANGEDTFSDIAHIPDEEHGLWSLHLFESGELDAAEDEFGLGGKKKLLTKPEDNAKTSKPAYFTKADANPKVAKNLGKQVYTIPLHLSPADSSGFNVCPCASAGCKAACLHYAGDVRRMKGKEEARIRKTLLYADPKTRPLFMRLLAREVVNHVRAAKRRDMLPAVRLNATSDVAWERVPVEVNGVTYANIMEAFPEVFFYDYTKIKKRMLASLNDVNWPRNYHLTFSLSEENEKDAGEVLKAGGNVAVVFRLKPSQPFPSHFAIGGTEAEVIDGDEHDFRIEDPSGVIVGLRAKGSRGKSDDSGFVKDLTHDRA